MLAVLTILSIYLLCEDNDEIELIEYTFKSKRGEIDLKIPRKYIYRLTRAGVDKSKPKGGVKKMVTLKFYPSDLGDIDGRPISNSYWELLTLTAGSMADEARAELFLNRKGAHSEIIDIESDIPRYKRFLGRDKGRLKDVDYYYSNNHFIKCEVSCSIDTTYNYELSYSFSFGRENLDRVDKLIDFYRNKISEYIVKN